MLTRRGLRVALVVVGVATLTLTGVVGAQAAVVCPPEVEACFVDVGTPGTPPAGSGGGADSANGAESRACVHPTTGVVFPCYRESWGWFSNLDGCYYLARDPQPPADHQSWQGRYPDGLIYVVTCPTPLGGPGTNGGWTWLPSPPDGYGDASITPGELAAQAVDRMALTGPAIHITVPANGLGLVGVPVWLWTEVTPTTWGPNSATASVPGLAITATAQATSITWDMGDGTTVTCSSAGTPYVTGAIHSPTCEHVYTATSAGQPDDAFTITGTTTWEVTWAGGGTAGSLTVTRTAFTTVRIGEMQVLVTG